MRAVLAGIILVAVAAVGWFFWAGNKAGKASPNGGAAGVATAVAELGDVNFTVSVAGEIGPAEQVSVRPEVNGRISELPVDVGDRVKKGGLLFALDDRDLTIEVETREKEIESARLQLDKARIGMDQARRDYERNKELFEARLLSEQEFENSRRLYDSAIKDHELARNSIERSQKDLDLAKERLLKTRIAAPFDCTVLTRPVSVGQAVSGSGGFNSGTEVLSIADLSSMVIKAHVNQADVTHLKQGMEVTVAVDAMPNLKLRGKVERMAPQATIVNNIKGYATRIVLQNVDAGIQPGMTATLSIPVSSAQDVLTVPLAAVFSEQGERYVLVKSGDSFERRPVSIGVSDFFNVEITSGLAGGEVVALEQPAGMGWRIPGGTPGMTQQRSGAAPRPAGSSTVAATATSTPTTTNTNAPTTAGTPAAVPVSTPVARPATARSGT